MVAGPRRSLARCLCSSCVNGWGTLRGASRSTRYAFLVVLTIHVLTLSVFVGTALMIDLRLLGVTMMRVPASQVIGRLVPWTTAGLILMTTSGALLFYAAPLVRYARTSSFG